MDLKVVTSMKDVESADHLFVLADSDGEGLVELQVCLVEK